MKQFAAVVGILMVFAPAIIGFTLFVIDERHSARHSLITLGIIGWSLVALFLVMWGMRP